jgi:hypothetical protein
MKKLIVGLLMTITIDALGQATTRLAASPREFLPPGYVVLKKVVGDLNGDHHQDIVFEIQKETKKSNSQKNDSGDRPGVKARGIMVVFEKNGKYELAFENLSCLTTENNDGGNYFPPEFGVYIENGSLVIHYFQGRYGYKKYKFRYQNGDFDLIGYDASENHGPVVLRSVSINLLTKKMLIRENIRPDANPGEEKFKETWKRFSLQRTFRLSQISSLDGLDIEHLLQLDR